MDKAKLFNIRRRGGLGGLHALKANQVRLEHGQSIAEFGLRKTHRISSIRL
jgi:hypothetical protein